MNIYYTESTSTGGLNTFFGALKGGQDIKLSLKRWEQTKIRATQTQDIVLVKQPLLDQYHKSCVLQ